MALPLVVRRNDFRLTDDERLFPGSVAEYLASACTHETASAPAPVIDSRTRRPSSGSRPRRTNPADSSSRNAAATFELVIRSFSATSLGDGSGPRATMRRTCTAERETPRTGGSSRRSRRPSIRICVLNRRSASSSMTPILHTYST